MINIDTVYQKVLALCNKEQRGYITPQEFNLMADKTQKEIFENYFHNTKTAYHKPKNQMGVGFDEIEMIQQKLHPFKRTVTITQEANNSLLNIGTSIPVIDVINTISCNNKEVVELTEKELAYTQNHPLTKATKDRQVYVREGNMLFRLYPTPAEQQEYIVDIFRRPAPPKWAYVVVQKQALYNSNLSKNFQLHAAEEETVVTRILQLVGVVIEKPGVIEVAMADQANIKREQND